MAPPLSSPSTAKTCSAVRALISALTSSALRPVNRLPQPAATRPAVPSGRLANRAVWHDGREVAVKVQYPGAEEALRSDLRQLQRFSRLFQAVVPGLEVKPLLTELRNRMVEELDLSLIHISEPTRPY